MSDNSQNNTASGHDNPPVQQPAASPPTYDVPQSPQQVACSNCYTLIPMGARFCPTCGNAVPPPVPWPSIPAPAEAGPKRNTVLIVMAVILIVVLVGGVAGYLYYQNVQQQVLRAAKNSEADAANQAPNQLQSTCFSNSTDPTHLSYSTVSGFSGYITEYEKMGVSNPTAFIIDATWTLTLDYPSPGWVLSDTETFHLVPHGVAYPTFSLTVTGQQLNNTPHNANFTTFTGTLDGTYAVTGTYGTYNPTSHSTYDSASNTGGGTATPGSGLPKC